MIHIRPAIAADLPVLLEFEQGIVAAERPFDNTLKEGIIHYYDLAALITAEDAEVLVAEYAGEIIGSGHARIRDAKPYQVFPKYAYLGFMYVVPEHRGKGVNRMIIEGLGAWAVQQGIRELRLAVYADNAAAVRAYETFGCRQNLVEMRLPL